MCADHAPLPSPAAAHAVVRADIMYGGDGIITTPTDPNIRERENFLEIVRHILLPLLLPLLPLLKAVPWVSARDPRLPQARHGHPRRLVRLPDEE